MNSAIHNVNLTTEQQEAISEIDRNLQIIACAGSGKTEVITRRIANILQSKPGIKPENIVAFTFTEKAAESMKKRITKALGNNSTYNIEKMYIGTIHGFCYHLLNKYTEQFREYKVLDSVKSHLFVARYCNECGMSDLNLEPYPRNVNLFLQCIDKMIDDCVITSFDYKAIKKSKQCNEDIQVGYILSVAYGDFYEMDDVDFFSINASFLTKRTVDAIHKSGKMVFAWTVNNETSIKNLTNKGVDIIITDEPVLAREVIYSRDTSETLINMIKYVFNG